MQLLDIALNIRRIRKEKQLTLTQLANRLEITPGFLSRLENFRTIPSLHMLMNIARTLEVDLEDLVRANTEAVDYVVTRKEQGVEVEREHPESGMHYHALAHDMPNKRMSPFIITIPPYTKRSPVTTDGDEFFLVLRGTLRYFIGADEVLLEKGDSLYFRGEIPHYPDNSSDKEVLLLGVYVME
jgi:transcriptional regulator with XRE-family HTH domain